LFLVEIRRCEKEKHQYSQYQFIVSIQVR